MVNYAIIEDDTILLGSAISLADIPYLDYILTENLSLPNTPAETWDYIDGEFVVNTRKLLDFNRKNMPQLKPMDFDLLLDKNGLYDAVQELIKQDRSLYIAYNRATYFSRTDPFIEQARIALGLTDEQVDEMWV